MQPAPPAARPRHNVTAVASDAELVPLMNIAALACGAPAVVIARLTHGDLRVRASRGISEMDLLSLEFSALFSLVLKHRASALLVLDVLSPPNLREGLASTPFKFFAGVRLVHNVRAFRWAIQLLYLLRCGSSGESGIYYAPTVVQSKSTCRVQPSVCSA